MNQTDQIFWEVNEYLRLNKVKHSIESIMECLQEEIRELVNQLDHSLPFKKRIEIIDMIYAKQSDIYVLRRKLRVIKFNNFIKKVMGVVDES